MLTKEWKSMRQALTWDRSIRRFYLTVLGIAIVGSLLIYFSGPVSASIAFLHRHFVEEVGKAFIVAAFLAASVDVFLKRRLASEFVRDVSPFIEGIGLPNEFQDEIAFIRRMPVYRKNWHLTYRLIRDGKLPEGYLRSKMSTTCEVINHTEDVQKFMHITSAEQPYEQFDPPTISAGVIRGAKQESKAGQFNAITKQCECDIPLDLDAKTDDLTCWSEIESVAEISDSDIFYLTYPTVNVTVQMEVPDDLEVNVYIGHRFQEADPGRVRTIPPDPSRAHTWHLTAAMLAWNAIYIEWKPRKKQTPRDAPA